MIDSGTAKEHHYAAGDAIAVAGRRPGPPLHDHGDREASAASTIGGPTIAVFDLPTAQAAARQARPLDEIYIAARDGVAPAQLVRGRSGRCCPPTPRSGPPARRPRQGAKEVDRASHVLALPARVRRHRLLRRRVRHLQHALDHGRPARPRAGDPAHARRLAAAGARLGPARDARLGLLASLIGLSPGSASPRASTRCSPRSASTCRRRTWFAARTVVICLVTGTLVTILAGLVPALRATRVPPISAVREGALPPPSRLARLGPTPPAR